MVRFIKMAFIFYGISLFLVSRISHVLMESAIENYWFVAKIVVSLSIFTALARIFLNQVTFGSYGNLKDILKDSLKFLIFIALVPNIFTSAVTFTDDLSEKITNSAQVTKYKSFDELKDSIKNGESNEESGLNTAIQLLRQNSAEFYKMCVTWISVTISQFLNYFRNLLLVMLFASAPIFIYLGIMLGLRFYSKIILSMGISLLIWPVMSSLLTKFSVTVFQADSSNLVASMSQGSSLFIFAIAQLLVPIYAAKSALHATSQIQSALSSITDFSLSGKRMSSMGSSVGSTKYEKSKSGGV